MLTAGKVPLRLIPTLAPRRALPAFLPGAEQKLPMGFTIKYIGNRETSQASMYEFSFHKSGQKHPTFLSVRETTRKPGLGFVDWLQNPEQRLISQLFPGESELLPDPVARAALGFLKRVAPQLDTLRIYTNAPSKRGRKYKDFPFLVTRVQEGAIVKGRTFIHE